MARNRALKPRTPSTYENSSHGDWGSMLPRDDRTINTSLCKVNMIRPKFKEGPTTVRPWPALDYADPSKLVPGFKHADGHGQNIWVVSCPAVKFVGLPTGSQFTFLLYPPHLVDANPALKDENPYVILYNACANACEAGDFGPGRLWNPYWTKLLKRAKGQVGTPLPKPNRIAFMQGEVYVAGDKDFIALKDRGVPLGGHEKDDLVVLQFSGSSFISLLDLLDTEKAPVPAGDFTKQPWLKSQFGDPTGLPQADGSVKGGLFVHFFNPNKAKIVDGQIKVRLKDGKVVQKNVKLVKASGQTYQKERTTWDGKIKDMQGYEIAVTSSYKDESQQIHAPDMDAARAERVRDHFQFWWDDENDPNEKGLLRIPCVEEQCRYMAQGLAGVTEVDKLFRFAWGDHTEFFNDEINGILRARRVAVMPGTPEEKAAARAGGRQARTDPTMSPSQAPADEIYDDVAGDDEAGEETAGEAGEVDGEGTALDTTEGVDEIAGDDLPEGTEEDPAVEAALAEEEAAGGESGEEYQDPDEPQAANQTVSDEELFPEGTGSGNEEDEALAAEAGEDEAAEGEGEGEGEPTDEGSEPAEEIVADGAKAKAAEARMAESSRLAKERAGKRVTPPPATAKPVPAKTAPVATKPTGKPAGKAPPAPSKPAGKTNKK